MTRSPRIEKAVGRSVKEWVADHPDQAIPPRVKLRIWLREDGRCSITGRKILRGDAFDFEHRKALCNGGEHRESNIVLALRDKHREKTAEDVAIKAKTERTAKKHLGLKEPARGFRGWRKFDGTAVWRDDR